MVAERFCYRFRFVIKYDRLGNIQICVYSTLMGAFGGVYIDEYSSNYAVDNPYDSFFRYYSLCPAL